MAALLTTLLLVLTGCTLDRTGSLFGEGGTGGSAGGPDGGAGVGGDAGAGGQGGDAGGAGGDAGAGGEGGCVPTGEELCDGVDNDCNPDTEDGADELTLGDGCSTGLDGICAAGTMKCESASMECVQDNQPAVTENCSNSFDDDCDGNVNNGCPYTATFLGDGDNCHKIVTLDGSNMIEPSNSSPDGACIGTMLVTSIFGGTSRESSTMILRSPWTPKLPS